MTRRMHGLIAGAGVVLAVSAGAFAQEEPQPVVRARRGVAPPPEPIPLSPFQPDLTPGYVLIEQDIQVPLHQYVALMTGVGDATFGSVTYWPNGIVPYDFVTSGGGAVSAANQAAAIAAINAITARSGVTLRPATGSDVDRIRFQNSNFNNAPIGKQGGTQIINIVSWGTQIIICHEIYHCLGFWHEQSRPDRGSFVTINSGNICGNGAGACAPATCCLCIDNNNACTSCSFNFNTQPGVPTYGAYDFDSFMHYGRTAFSCNGGDTITVNASWNAQWQDAIGQRDHFSYFDRITCRGLYPYNTDRWLDQTWFGSQGGTFLLPWNLSFANAMFSMPSGGTLFLKAPGTLSAVGTYSTPVTIDAPAGPVTLGN
jgi:hypothetical protein